MIDQETQPVVPVAEPAPPAVPAKLPRSARKRGIPTWIVGVVMLVIGVAIGFFGRPLVLPPPAPSSTSALVEAVLAQTRHFEGNANAPVTLIEFSDFQ